MPNPKSGESEKDFMSRCMAYDDMQKYKPDQRAAICHSKYNEAHKSEHPVTKSIKTIEDNLDSVLKARTVGGFESPEPGNIPEKEKEILARVYAEQRKKGMSKEKASKIAWGAVHNYRNAHKGENMNPVKKSLGVINNNLNSVKKSFMSVNKANEGDTRMIFGKPYIMQGGKWVQTGGNVTTDNAPDEISGDQITDMTDTLTDEDRESIQYNIDQTPTRGLERWRDSFTEEDLKNPESKAIYDMIISDLSSEARQPIGTGNEVDEQWGDPTELVAEYGDILAEMASEELGEMAFDLNSREIAEHFGGETGIREVLGLDEMEKSMNGNVKKSYSKIQKNLAGVHDAMTRTGATTYTDDHAHSYQIDRDGNGATTGIVGEYGVDHIHEIRNFEVSSAQEHEHMI